MHSTTRSTTAPERLAIKAFNEDRPARIHRPQTAKWEPRLEGTPEEARAAAALIRAQQARRKVA
jgi:hypothetical protein